LKAISSLVQLENISSLVQFSSIFRNEFHCFKLQSAYDLFHSWVMTNNHAFTEDEEIYFAHLLLATYCTWFVFSFWLTKSTALG